MRQLTTVGVIVGGTRERAWPDRGTLVRGTNEAVIVIGDKRRKGIRSPRAEVHQGAVAYVGVAISKVELLHNQDYNNIRALREMTC